MDFVGSGVGGGSGNNVANIIGSDVVASSNGGVGVVTTNVGASLGSENGPILYSEPNRTSAIDDIRSVVIYIFIITIFLSFFLILPGIRYEKFPTFLCITTSLIVTSIILVTLFGTSWHVAEAPISAAYKAFSRDRIQGDLSVRIGLQSVNITLQAHKYYILHATHGPIIMDNSPIPPSPSNNLQQVSPTTQQSPLPTTTTVASAATTILSEQSFINGQSRPISRSISEENSAKVSSFLDDNHNEEEHSATSGVINSSPANNLAEELLGGRTSDGATVDTELEVEEVFANSKIKESSQQARRTARSSTNETNKSPSGSLKKRSTETTATSAKEASNRTNNSFSRPSPKNKHLNNDNHKSSSPPPQSSSPYSPTGQKYTIKRVNVDINYNERFYWIEPNQMRQEHHNALERGLPYPILTVVEYLSQDAAGFSWSRQYRLAGYYSYITLWLSLCVCILMFFLHCAAPKYGIYTMQILGCLLLFTNFTYATLVPRGEQKLVIPFEGQSLTFDFGWHFWLVLFGGCLSLTVGTLIVIIDCLFPNFIFTTVLDVDFDSHNKYYKHRMKRKCIENERLNENHHQINHQRPVKPPFFHDSSTTISTNSASSSTSSSLTSKTNSPLSSIVGSSSERSQQQHQQQYYNSEINKTGQLRAIADSNRQSSSTTTMTARHRHLPLKVINDDAVVREAASHNLDQLFVNSNKRSALTNDNEFITLTTSKVHHLREQDSSVVEILEDRDITGVDKSVGTPTSDIPKQNRLPKQARISRHQHHHHHNNRTNKNNISITDHLSRRQVVATDDGSDDHQFQQPQSGPTQYASATTTFSIILFSIHFCDKQANLMLTLVKCDFQKSPIQLNQHNLQLQQQQQQQQQQQSKQLNPINIAIQDKQLGSFQPSSSSYQDANITLSNRPIERPSLDLVQADRKKTTQTSRPTNPISSSPAMTEDLMFAEEGKSIASFTDARNSTKKVNKRKSSSNNNIKSSNKTLFDDEQSVDSSDSNEIYDDVEGDASGLAGTQKEPDCASHGRYYCTYKEEYPSKLVTEVTKYYKWPLEKLFRDLHAQIMPKLAQDSTGNLVCDSITRVVRPGWARNTNERWLVVINSENYHQYVTEVVCQYGSNSRCNFIPPCYYSSCQQRYNTQKLLVIDPLNPYRGPFLSEFLFPSCCVCYVPSAADSYQDKYRPSPATIYQRTLQQESASNLYPPQFRPPGLMEDVQSSLVEQALSSASSGSSAAASSSSSSKHQHQQQQQQVKSENVAAGPGEIRREGDQYKREVGMSGSKQNSRQQDENLMIDFPRL